MKNWSTDITELMKDPVAYDVWRLQQLINFGLDGEKLSREKLMKYWDRLEVDPESKAYLEFLLWPRQPHPTS